MKNTHWKAHCNLLLGATALMLTSMAGCGGGGGGGRKVVATPGPTNLPSVDPPPTPVPTLAPTPVPTATPRPDGTCPINPTTYQPNYAAALIAGFTDTATGNVQPPGTLGRHAGYPLKVYFAPNEFATDARKAYAQEGFNQWVTGTGNRVRYTITTNKAEAFVVVTFSPYSDAEDQGILGLATTAIDPNNVLFEFFQDTRAVDDTEKAGHLLLNFTGNSRTDLTTAAHEFGHILGIRGHSPDNLDQMYFADNPNNSGLTTAADINTLRTAACDNFPQLANARQLRRRNMTDGPYRIQTIADTFESMGIPRPKK